MSDLPTVLFVDDEPSFLDGIVANIRNLYKVKTFTEPEKALEHIGANSYMVIVSDYKMPRMNGVEFLRHAYRICPTSVRMMLTGHADLNVAIDAVNEGNIFRILTKPCSPDNLKRSLSDAVDQHRYITADNNLLQRKLDQLTEQLVRTERLTTLGALAGGVGHELKNIAHVLAMIVQLISVENPEGKANYLTELQTVLSHLEKHAASLLNLGSPPNEVESVLDLSEVVTSTMEMLRTTGKLKPIRLSLSIPPNPPKIRGNRIHFEQVIMNLVGNAVDAIMENRHNPKELSVSLVFENDEIRLVFADTGAGISEENLQKIFNSYFTTKAPGKGTGLGLPVVQQIAEMYHGTVNVESTKGKGSVFTFQIPYVPVNDSIGR